MTRAVKAFQPVDNLERRNRRPNIADEVGDLLGEA